MTTNDNIVTKEPSIVSGIGLWENFGNYLNEWLKFEIFNFLGENEICENVLTLVRTLINYCKINSSLIVIPLLTT